MKILRRAGGRRWLYLPLAILVLGTYSYWALHRPLPPIEPMHGSQELQAQASVSKLAWPAEGQSAVGVVGSSILDMHGKEDPLPTASTAKLITALVVLQEKPLRLGGQGPIITLSNKDVTLYNSYALQDGSVARVTSGEQISEYQMLQTILLPSANNMADSLAIWAFGSLKAYQAAANQYLENLGLVTTHVGSDASGLSPSTTSTAHDLVQIGELVMQHSVLAQIVGQSSASGIPVVGDIKNVNFLLGTNGIIGIKTGNTEQAGGVFVGAANTIVNDKPVTIVTAVIGAPSLFAAMKNSAPLIQSAQTSFTPVSMVKAGATMGEYKLPWGGSILAVASKDLVVKIWNDSSVSATIRLDPLLVTAKAGQTVGSVTTEPSGIATKHSIPVKLQTTPIKPSARWRLLHP